MVATFLLILFILPTIINGKLCRPQAEGNLTIVSLSPYEKKVTLNIRLVMRMLNKRRKPTERTLKAYDPQKLYNVTSLFVGFKMGETVCTKDKKTPPCPIDDNRPKKFCTFSLHHEIIKPEDVNCQHMDCQVLTTNKLAYFANSMIFSTRQYLPI
ncbi:hypothetical protein D918_08128 [Trichuris suis]|nr:hypothetical protein D918_08128 [Trichuris suis]